MNRSKEKAPALGAAVATGLAALLGYFLLVVALQHWQRAPGAQFGGYPDEPSHYVSGVMVRDYLTSGFHRTPTAFARDFYLRAPYFAIGYWPPLFYFAEAFWMLCFGPGRPAALLLIALIAALVATLIFYALRSSLGSLSAFGCGALFLLLPTVESNSMLVMTDLPVTLLSFGALLALAAYLQSGRVAPLIVFTILTAMTILTKGSGLFLIAVLPCALLATGRLHWLFRPSFWIAPFGVAMLCAPWYIVSHKFLDRGFLTRTDFMIGVRVLGWDTVRDLALLAPLAAWGVWKILRPRPIPPLAAICMIQPIILVVFLMAAPVIVEPRYMMPALPPLIVLAGLGIHSIAESTLRGRTTALAATGLLVAVAGVRIYLYAPPPAVNMIRPVAEFAVHHTAPFYRAVMVSSDLEGPMIAEIVALEPQSMARYLIRPGKVLAHMDWLGRGYQELYGNTEQIQALFDRVPVDLVILRTNLTSSALPHERMLAATINASPTQWRRVFPSVGESSLYEAYEPVRTTVDDPKAIEQFLEHELTPLGGATLIGKPDFHTP